MKRVVIETSNLSKNTWNIIYKLIEKCYGRLEFSENDFEKLKSVALVVFDDNPKNIDVCTCYDYEKLEYSDLKSTDGKWIFNIIYDKQNTKENFADIIPYFLLKAKYTDYITLGIDLGGITEPNQKNSLIFKYSIFLFFIEDKKPALGEHSIYFINEKGIPNASSFKYKKSKPDVNKASREYLPLIKVNRDDYQYSFTSAMDENPTLLNQYISESTDKKVHEYKGPWFESWLKILFLKQKSIADLNEKEREQYEQLLHDYFVDIHELVQNIINHTDLKQGLLYANFTRKQDLYNVNDTIPPYPYSEIPDIAKYDNEQRFLEIGIYDFNKQGIGDVSTKKLEHWFGGETSTYEDSRHVGIRHFVNSVKNHRGFFSVETNQQGLGVDNKLWLDSSSMPKSGTPTKNIDGTFYHIILPILPPENIKTVDAVRDWRFNLENRTIKSVEKELYLSGFNSDKSINDTPKEKMESYVDKCAEAIVEETGFYGSIAIDIHKIEPKIVSEIFLVKLYKRLVSLYIKEEKVLSEVVFYGLSDTLIDGIYQDKGYKIAQHKINDGESSPSIEIPIILLSDDLRRLQIIAGKEDNEYNAINNGIKYYPKTKPIFSQTGNSSYDKKYDKLLENHYERIINNESVFPDGLSIILDNIIGRKTPGCRHQYPYTQLNNELVVKNYYEAYFLFQDSWFVERIALCIAKKLLIDIKFESKTTEKINVAIVGYKEYSNLLIEYIEQFLEKEGNSTTKIDVRFLAIANQKADNTDNEFVFDGISESDKPEKLDKIIIVIPINSSCQTHYFIEDALIEQFKIERDRCVHWTAVLVRDKEKPELTDQEKRYWTEIDISKKTVCYKNANNPESQLTVQYLIEKEGEWHYTLDDKFFPDVWKEEKTVNSTNNFSLNSKYIVSMPKMGVPENFDKSKNDERLEKCFKPYTCYGHIVNGANHQKYYFKTKDVVRNNIDKIKEWLHNCKVQDSENVCRIIVSLKGEEDFAYIVNSECFDGNAEIFTIDKSILRFDIPKKYKYLNSRYENKRISFSFVSHVLLTAEAFYQAKNVLSLIFPGKENIHFDYIFSLQCRLYDDRHQELLKHTSKDKFFSFSYLLIPPSSTNLDLDCHCSLCDLKSHYEKLRDKSTIFDCRKRIDSEIKKLEPKALDEVLSSPENEQVKDNRHWSRLKAKHDVFYELSLAHTDDEWASGLDKLFDENDSNLDFLDRKISLLKVLSLPELSQYVPVRYYIHQKLISELDNLFNKKSPDFDDLKLLKVILKQMSLLGMNALVRKYVIVHSWILYFRVRLNNPVDFASEKGDFGTDFQFFIKNVLFENEARSMWLGELLRTGKEENISYNNISISDTTLYNPLFSKPIDIKRKTLFGEYVGDINKFIDIKDVLNREYITFASRLFYDNTTIIRKSLETFENKKTLDSYCWGIPYKNKHDWMEESFKIISKSKDILQKPLIDDEKSNAINSFEDNAKDLLSMFRSLLGADIAFIAIRHKEEKKYKYYILTKVGENNSDDDLFNDWLERVSNAYYKKICDSPNCSVPISLCENLKDYAEGEIYFAGEPIRKEVCLHLKGESNNDNSVIAVFLFVNSDGKNSEFKIQLQEKCRMMLLLIPEIREYINRLHREGVREGVFNMWIEEGKSKRMYKRTNFTSNHKLDLGRWDFESLDETNYPRIYRGMYMLSNIVVSHMYSLLYANKKYDMSQTGTTLKQVFSPKFISLLDELNKTKWMSTLNHIDEVEIDCDIPMSTYILQSFVIQLIDNAFNKYANPRKQIEVTFRNDGFCISNDILSVDEDTLAKAKEDFDKKYDLNQIDKRIEGNDILEYGMTLISFIKYCQSVDMVCEPNFTIGKMPRFILTVKKY